MSFIEIEVLNDMAQLHYEYPNNNIVYVNTDNIVAVYPTNEFKCGSVTSYKTVTGDMYQYVGTHNELLRKIRKAT